MQKFTLPAHVTERLMEQRARQDTSQHFFSSTLETGEFLLAREAGWEPLGQVMGSTVYHIGGQFTNPNWRDSDRQRTQAEGIHFEMTTWTQAFYSARRLAMSRMREEATLLGASGVIGVRLRHERQPAQTNLIEFVAMGTAVRERGRMARPDTEPFLSNLSGNDSWQLMRMRWRPVDLALGACCYYQGTTWKTQNSLWSRRNFEVPELTRGVYTARELAMERLKAEARSQGATGVIGVEVEVDKDTHAYAPVTASTNNGAQGNLHAVFNFFALGTSIVRAPEGERTNQIMPVVEAI